jgi:xanthine/CO dehydrogenase XdhC/CoxF family maturation factor
VERRTLSLACSPSAHQARGDSSSRAWPTARSALVDAGDELQRRPGAGAEQARRGRRRLRSRQERPLESSDGTLFARAYSPAPRMVIVGAVHITQALAPMAAMAGFEVIVIDPRRAFATAERLPGVTVTTSGPTRRWRASASTRRRPW